MKKIFPFLALCLLFSFTGQIAAQGVTLEGLNFGAYLGPNLTFPKVADQADTDETSSGVGIEGGIVVDYGINSYLGFGSGLVISTRGFKREWQAQNLLTAAETVKLTSNQNFTTLAIPLIVRVRPGNRISKISGFATVGFIPEINFSYRNKYDKQNVVELQGGNEIVEISQEDETSKENINVFSSSAQFGLGLLAGGAFVKLSYSLGLIDVINTPDVLTGTPQAKISYATLSVGYFF